MTTLGDAVSAIARRLLDDSNTAVTTVEIREAINEAIKKWKFRRFWFNVNTYTWNIEEYDQFVTLPTDYLVTIPKNAFTLQFSLFTYQVKKYSPTRFDAIFSASIIGRPLRYVERQGYLEFSPAANQEYPATLYYLKDYTAFATDGSADTQTNDFLTNAYMLIRSEALAQLHGELRQDDKMEERYMSRVNSEYNSLNLLTQKRLKTGTVTVEHSGEY